MKLNLMISALAVAGLAACGAREATEAKAPPQPIVAQIEQPKPQVPVSEKYPAPKTEANLGEKEPLDPGEQEKR